MVRALSRSAVAATRTPAHKKTHLQLHIRLPACKIVDKSMENGVFPYINTAYICN